MKTKEQAAQEHTYYTRNDAGIEPTAAQRWGIQCFIAGAEWQDKHTHSLCEAVADIAYIAGHEGYYSEDSRADIAQFIAWAEEFERLHEGVEWGVTPGMEYIDAIEEFAHTKIPPCKVLKDDTGRVICESRVKITKK